MCQIGANNILEELFFFCTRYVHKYRNGDMKAKNTEIQKIYVRYRVADNTFWTTGSLLPVMAIKPRLRLIRGVMYSSLPSTQPYFSGKLSRFVTSFMMSDVQVSKSIHYI